MRLRASIIAVTYPSAVSEFHVTTVIPATIKSSFSITLMYTTSSRIPAGASTNQASEKGDLILLGGQVKDRHPCKV